MSWRGRQLKRPRIRAGGFYFFSRLRRSFSRASRANFAATPLLRPAWQNRHATQATVDKIRLTSLRTEAYYLTVSTIGKFSSDKKFLSGHFTSSLRAKGSVIWTLKKATDVMFIFLQISYMFFFLQDSDKCIFSFLKIWNMIWVSIKVVLQNSTFCCGCCDRWAEPEN